VDVAVDVHLLGEGEDTVLGRDPGFRAGDRGRRIEDERVQNSFPFFFFCSASSVSSVTTF
jgi:hypothetical protein